MAENNAALMPFEYEGKQVRVVTGEDGEPWFVATDVAKILGYRDAPNMTRRLDAEDQAYSKVSTLGGEQSLTAINESGLYDAVFRSNAEGAKPFRRWVTSEVLPSIRKHGAYLTTEKAEAIISNPDVIITLAQQVKDERAKVLELTPKAEAWEVFLEDGKDYSVRDAAMLLFRDPNVQVGQIRLFKFLRDLGWVGVHKSRNGRLYPPRPMQVAIEAGYLTRFIDDHGNIFTHVTPKGLEKLRVMLVDAGEVAA